MDQQLLVDIIKRQAGSLWKATIEGVMNAIDAGASTCEIELTRNMLTIRDNGKGFRSRSDIEDFFEVFGKMHEARENKTFGAFRMGRGQLFAFGHNIWRSGEFEMVVNIERDGLDYHLTEGLDHRDGCSVTVELFKQLSHTQLSQLQEEIKSNAKYVELNATLNGDKFVANRARVPWDVETPEADIRYRANQDLRVYNQGIKVISYYRYKYGVGGDVVTKKPLKVNFARNDIMDDCPVWRKVLKEITKRANAEQTRTRSTPGTQRRRTGNRAAPVRLTEDDRVRLCNQAKDGELEAQQFKNAQLFKRFEQRANLTVRQVHNVARGQVTSPPRGADNYSYRHRSNVAAITINQLACVIDNTTLTRFGLQNCEALVALVNRVIGGYDRYALTYIPWGDLVASLNSKSQIIDDSQLNRVESVVLGCLRQNVNQLWRAWPGGPGKNLHDMRIVLGYGPLTSWTDGKTYIAINREHVRDMKTGPTAWMRYAHLLVHEALHSTPSFKAHKHTKAFYARYHDWMGNRWGIGQFMYNCSVRMPTVAEFVNARMTEQELREADRLEEGLELAENLHGPAENEEDDSRPPLVVAAEAPVDAEAPAVL